MRNLRVAAALPGVVAQGDLVVGKALQHVGEVIRDLGELVVVGPEPPVQLQVGQLASPVKNQD